MDSRHLVAESVVQPLSAKQVDMINDLFQSIRSNQLPAVGNALRNLATQHQHINIANIVDKKNQTVLHEAACLDLPNKLLHATPFGFFCLQYWLCLYVDVVLLNFATHYRPPAVDLSVSIEISHLSCPLVLLIGVGLHSLQPNDANPY